jgi:NAD(P)H dehydrogenase (quinone)
MHKMALSDRERRYVTQHKIHILSDVIVCRLVTHKPADPIASIVRTIRECAKDPIGPPAAPTEADFADARPYLEKHRISDVIDQWLKQMLHEQPLKPMDWSQNFFVGLAGGSFPATDNPLSMPLGGGAAASPAVLSKANPNPKILILYYSAYGHVSALAHAAVQGVQEFPGAQVELRRFPETLSKEQVSFQSITLETHVPIATPQDLVNADGIIFGFPAKFGNPPAQVSAFMETSSATFNRGSLVGKPAAVLISTATQHGGRETAGMIFFRSLLHHGMVFLGPVPKDVDTGISGVAGGSHYAAGTVAATSGERDVSDKEKQIAKRLALRLTTTASKLSSPFR